MIGRTDTTQRGVGFIHKVSGIITALSLLLGSGDRTLERPGPEVGGGEGGDEGEPGQTPRPMALASRFSWGSALLPFSFSQNKPTERLRPEHATSSGARTPWWELITFGRSLELLNKHKFSQTTNLQLRTGSPAEQSSIRHTTPLTKIETSNSLRERRSPSINRHKKSLTGHKARPSTPQARHEAGHSQNRPAGTPTGQAEGLPAGLSCSVLMSSLRDSREYQRRYPCVLPVCGCG